MALQKYATGEPPTSGERIRGDNSLRTGFLLRLAKRYHGDALMSKFVGGSADSATIHQDQRRNTILWITDTQPTCMKQQSSRNRHDDFLFLFGTSESTQ
ncbi:MAG: hypothetical protein AAF989_07845 [Planctomycetota bacterium]